MEIESLSNISRLEFPHFWAYLGQFRPILYFNLSIGLAILLFTEALISQLLRLVKILNGFIDGADDTLDRASHTLYSIGRAGNIGK